MDRSSHLLLAALVTLAGCAVLRPGGQVPAPQRAAEVADAGAPVAAPAPAQPPAQETDVGQPLSAVDAVDAGHAAVVPALGTGVDTAPAREDEVRGGGDGQEVPGYGEPDQSHVLEVARSLLTYRYVRVGRGGGFRLDCSGYVRAVHLSLGLDLFVPRTDDTASRPTHVGGVGLILWYNQHHGTFWPRSGPPEAYAVEPRPGDIVYFHDTHDRNKNRRFDDPFTHVGLVESVDADGTVTFLHAAGHIVKREKMNLRHPRKTRDEAGNIINHALRVRKRWEKPGDPHLAAELFAGYGRLQRPSHLPAFTEERAISVLPTGKQYARGVRKPGRGKRRDREPADRVARTSKNGKAKKTGKAAKKTHTSSKRGNARTR